jgi:hypothetical protein
MRAAMLADRESACQRMPMFGLDFIVKRVSARPAVASYQFILDRVRV